MTTNIIRNDRVLQQYS